LTKTEDEEMIIINTAGRSTYPERKSVLKTEATRPLEPMWELNPRAHDAFVTIGITAPLLLGVVSVACGAAAYGLAYGRRWGYKLGVALLLVNLFGDAIHVIAGLEVRAAVGIPIVALLLWYLSSTNVRRYFSSAARPAA